MPVTAKCFVAYASQPPGRAEAIEDAVEKITGGGIDIITWRKLSVSGRAVISAICEVIRDRELFIADVTGLNPNVLFELGYAIALRKRVYLLLDPNIQQAKQQFDQFNLLTTIGYLPYANGFEIVDGFFRDQPFESLDKAVLDDFATAPPKPPGLLHLKPPINTHPAISISRRVDAAPLPKTIDDPVNAPSQTFGWYVQHVQNALGVSCHLLSTEYKNWELHNAKNALVAGLAYGMNRQLLMLSHDPYVSPIDYRDLLQSHKTSAQAEAIYTTWLLPIIESYERQSKNQQQYALSERARGELRNIAMGEPIAEFESDSILDYFVPTAAYSEALRSKHSIFVGRRGTGKTASLFKLTEDLRSDPRNHVCVVKPVDYEFQGLLTILSEQLAAAERGYLVESLWKFLLYTELAKSVYDELMGKPSFYTRSDGEQDLCLFVEEHRDLILPEFSLRLESAVYRLGELPQHSTYQTHRDTISERLHSGTLSRLRALLGRVLSTKAKVAILVDNLDKSWNQYTELERLSELLFGLLSVSARVAEEFAKESHWREPVNLCLTLFVRSDIYGAMVRFVRERDKLPVRRIRWEDPELLMRVVEERFVKSGADVGDPKEVWDKYFVPTVCGLQVREYLLGAVLPRPRDLIFLVKAALENAVNRGRPRIEEKDFLSAQEQYSRFALDSLIAEGTPQIKELDELLLQFVRGKRVVERDDVASVMRRAGVDETRLDDTIDLLTELTFLGPEISLDKFEFIYDEDKRAKVRIMARQFSQESSRPPRYLVNTPFHSFLELSSGIPVNQLEMDLTPGDGPVL